MKLKTNPLIEFLPDQHRTRMKDTGELIPWGTTQICSWDMSKEAMKSIGDTKHIWEPRGNALHDSAQAFLEGKPMPDPGVYSEWIDPLVNHPIWKKFSPIAVELRMVSPDRFFTGAFDCLLEGPSRDGDTIRVLADFKTLSKPHSPTRKLSRQLGSYLSLLLDTEQISVSKCMGIFCRPGSVELTVEEPDDCLGAWADCLDVFKKTLPDW